MATYIKFNADRRLLSADFDAIVPLLTPSVVEAARAIMVDGCPISEVAKQQKKSRRAMYDLVNGVWATYENYKECKAIEHSRAKEQLPPDWDIGLVAAPTQMLIDFKHTVDEARRKFLKINSHVKGQ